MTDPLYGMAPAPASKEHYGVSLGTMAVRGERNALIVDQDFLTRIASNPFFPYMLGRIEEGIERPAAPPSAAQAKPAIGPKAVMLPPERMSEVIHQAPVDP